MAGAQKATGLWRVVRSKAELTLSVAKVKGNLGGHLLWSLHELSANQESARNIPERPAQKCGWFHQCMQIIVLMPST